MWQRINPHWWQGLFWCTWTACTVLFLLPSSALPPVDIWDKLAHALVFAVLMVLANLAYQHWHADLQRALLLLFYGFLIECLQGLTSLRTFSLLDLLADSVGLSVILLVSYCLAGSIRRA